MNAIAMPENAIEAVSAETLTMQADDAGSMTSLIHDTRQIPLSKLVSSKKNVRKRNVAMTIPELAASIEAHGLIQNLTVRKAKRGGNYEIVAGSRRFAALLLLVAQGRIDKSALIPCNVRTGNASDTEISLAENTQREAMHVVDEILAYRQLAEDGMTPETIAARFGQSVATIRQRIKLANLSPRILDVMREDDISIEQARALAISDDHAAQEAVWFDHDHWNHEPHTIRSLLTREHVRISDRLARFVGLDAYEAAGGGIVRDLFAEDATTYLTDRALLVQLATTGLEKAAEPLHSQGWKWVEITLDASIIYNGGFGRIYPLERELSETEQDALSSLGDVFDGLAARIEAYGEGDTDIAADEARQLEVAQQIATVRSGTLAYDPDAMAMAGCIVTLAHNGALQVEMGCVRREDRVTPVRQNAEAEALEDDEAPALPAAAPDSEAGYSAALIEELTAIRTAAMRVELAARPQIALAAILYPLLSKVLIGGPTYWRSAPAVEISGQCRDLAPSIKETESCRALVEWSSVKETWADHIPGDPGDLWVWLLDQPIERLTDLLAFVAAANLNAVKAKHDHSRERLEQAEQIATALNLDMSAYWAPEKPFLSRLSKAGIGEVMREAGCSKDAVRAAEKAPKVEAVQLAETALRGKPWLPASLRLQGNAENNSDEGLAQAAA